MVLFDRNIDWNRRGCCHFNRRGSRRVRRYHDGASIYRSSNNGKCSCHYIVFWTNGVEPWGPLRQLALFLMNKAPVGLVDLFKDNPGSGSRTWMKYGIVWFLLALVSGFLGIWHNYDPTALDSLASIGWSYDDGSALADFTTSTFNLAFTYLVVGGCLVAVSRSANNRLVSKRL